MLKTLYLFQTLIKNRHNHMGYECEQANNIIEAIIYLTKSDEEFYNTYIVNNQATV